MPCEACRGEVPIEWRFCPVCGRRLRRGDNRYASVEQITDWLLTGQNQRRFGYHRSRERSAFIAMAIWYRYCAVPTLTLDEVAERIGRTRATAADITNQGCRQLMIDSRHNDWYRAICETPLWEAIYGPRPPDQARRSEEADALVTRG